MSTVFVIYKSALTDGACPNTLYSCRNESSSSSIDATFPHLELVGQSNAQTARVGVPIAVVWRTPYCHNQPIEEMLVSFHSKLVRAGDEVNVIGPNELPNSVAAEQEACAARRQPPAVDF